MKLGNLKSIKPRVFKFKEGQIWDGVEDIFDYIEELLVEEGEVGEPSKVKQDTYITIMCAVKTKANKEVRVR